MKVDLMFKEVALVCKRRVVEDIELDKIAQHLNDDRRFIDEFVCEHQWTELDVLCFEGQTEFDEDEALIVRIENIDGMTQQQVLNHAYEQLADGVNDGWLDTKELGVLQLCIQPRLAKLKQ